MSEVVRPRDDGYRVTFHQWLSGGSNASRILPTICVHMCTVACVSAHDEPFAEDKLSCGQRDAMRTPLFGDDTHASQYADRTRL